MKTLKRYSSELVLIYFPILILMILASVFFSNFLLIVLTIFAFGFLALSIPVILYSFFKKTETNFIKFLKSLIQLVLLTFSSSLFFYGLIYSFAFLHFSSTANFSPADLDFNLYSHDWTYTFFPWPLICIMAYFFSDFHKDSNHPASSNHTVSVIMPLSRFTSKSDSIIWVGGELFARQGLLFTLSLTLCILALNIMTLFPDVWHIHFGVTSLNLVYFFCIAFLLKTEIVNKLIKFLFNFKINLSFIFIINIFVFLIIFYALKILFFELSLNVYLDSDYFHWISKITNQTLLALFSFFWWLGITPILANTISSFIKSIPFSLVFFVTILVSWLSNQFLFHNPAEIEIHYLPYLSCVLIFFFLICFKQTLPAHFKVLIYKEMAAKRLPARFIEGSIFTFFMLSGIYLLTGAKGAVAILASVNGVMLITILLCTIGWGKEVFVEKTQA